MKKSLWFVFLSGFVLTFYLRAQDETKEFGIKLSGFIKNDFFYDTRQTVNLREGHFLQYPAGESLDANKKDMNAVPNFNFLSIQTRLSGAVTAPDALGAKVSGLVEADFFGNENAAFVDNNGFRLRHAFAKLNWTNTELLFGQYWHPMFVPNCYSEVISFNTGSPIQPFSRNPQIRITQKIDNIRLIGVAASQRDFTSPGGSALLRNSGVPDLHAQIQYELKNQETKKEFLSGLGAGFKMIKPLLFTEKNGKKYRTHETVSGVTATAFVKYKTADFSVKGQGVYGQNVFDLLMLGGYAVTSVSDTTQNTVTYSPFTTMSVWAEGTWATGKFQFGLWLGYTKNIGASDSVAFYTNKVPVVNIKDDVTLRGGDIKNVWRISPRVVYTAGKISLALETEYTNAAYARTDTNGKLVRNIKGEVTSSKNIANLRAVFATILKF
jgi:hypothetical protein